MQTRTMSVVRCPGVLPETRERNCARRIEETVAAVLSSNVESSLYGTISRSIVGVEKSGESERKYEEDRECE